jgi:hypothetical protein
MTLLSHILGLLYFALGLIDHAISLYNRWRDRDKSDKG